MSMIKRVVKTTADSMMKAIIRRAAGVAIERALVAWDNRDVRGRVCLEISSYQESFQWATVYLQHLGAFKGGQQFKLRSAYLLGDEGNWDWRPMLAPGAGNYSARYRGEIVPIKVETEEKKQGPSQVTIRMYFRSRKEADQFSDEAHAFAREQEEAEDTIKIRRWGKEWSSPLQTPQRPLSSVVLQSGQMDEVLDHIHQFERDKDLYLRRGQPHRTGILLEGPPGTGKTSTIRAIASHLDKDVYIVDLKSTSDSGFVAALREVPPGHIVLFEDIDAAFSNGRSDDNERRSFMTLKGILNGLDGIESPEHVIYFMTTNHPERLDPALVRPGRIDLQLHLGTVSEDQARRMYLQFFPEEPEMSERFGHDAKDRFVPAELQRFLIEAESPNDVLTRITQ